MKRVSPFYYWLPRIICIVAILFISVFALDAFDPRFTIWQQIGAFALHLVPTFILILFLWIAWKWELLGGLLFIGLGLSTSLFIYQHNHNVNHFTIVQSINAVLLINLPFVIVGILFIISHNKQKKQLPANH